ncbi:hypothetical protein, partial [Pseudomonas syringae group genomosp. 7]|uniref:hypothetical protein n=1 Tax=Pseudomonas syringae group genomosp. 7 TaxID=251699 RepID=UPI00377037EE
MVVWVLCVLWVGLLGVVVLFLGGGFVVGLVGVFGVLGVLVVLVGWLVCGLLVFLMACWGGMVFVVGFGLVWVCWCFGCLLFLVLLLGLWLWRGVFLWLLLYGHTLRFVLSVVSDFQQGQPGG